MTRSVFGQVALMVGLAGGTAGVPAMAADVFVEAPLATRVVPVSRADLASVDRLAVLQRQLRTAARAACDEQYSAGYTYYHLRACYSGSFRDALKQLRELRARRFDRLAGVGVQLAISIRTK